MIRVGVIGCGYWGPNLVRNFVRLETCEVVAVSDLNQKKLEQIANHYPGIETVTHARELIADPRIDAVIIATPVSTHFDMAMGAVQAGKHVMVTKPLAATADQAQKLIVEADRHRRVLMVDHTFIYTGAVRKIHELVKSDTLGDLYYYDSVRVNLGLFQHDVNVIWDLAVHDLSILDYVQRSPPTAISATGVNHVLDEPENIAYLTLFFDGSFIAHLHVNWLAPVKIRKTLIGGSQKMIVYDDLEPSEKIKVYDKGITLAHTAEGRYQLLAGYRAGDMWAPQLELTEALSIEVAHFVECIEKNEQPLTDGESGLRVVRMLEAATQSMKERGRPVELRWDRREA